MQCIRHRASQAQSKGITKDRRLSLSKSRLWYTVLGVHRLSHRGYADVRDSASADVGSMAQLATGGSGLLVGAVVTAHSGLRQAQPPGFDRLSHRGYADVRDSASADVGSMHNSDGG